MSDPLTVLAEIERGQDDNENHLFVVRLAEKFLRNITHDRERYLDMFTFEVMGERETSPLDVVLAPEDGRIPF